MTTTFSPGPTPNTVRNGLHGTVPDQCRNTASSSSIKINTTTMISRTSIR